MRLGSLILAGGRSTRMGRPKELLPFGGDTLLARAVTTLSRFAPIMVAARADQRLPVLPAAIDRVDDTSPGDGPLAAIAGALRFVRDHRGFTDGDALFVTGCDAPFLAAEVVDVLAARLGAASLAIPRVANVLQPLCAIWRLDTVPAIDELLRDGVLAPHRVAQRVITRIVEEDELRGVDPSLRSFRNVNSPDDYQRALLDAGT